MAIIQFTIWKVILLQILNVDGVTGGFNFQVSGLKRIILILRLERAKRFTVWRLAYFSVRKKMCNQLIVRFPQNAWTGGYIAGTSIARLALAPNLQEPQSYFQLERS